ncbi:hypothetical protein F4809DRAFT_600531 [Biscogniauxia mediterranea]|nr:hypothetical protein F4809DRAFT_600531 [Biscogniauxia mediterranea]
MFFVFLCPSVLPIFLFSYFFLLFFSSLFFSAESKGPRLSTYYLTYIMHLSAIVPYRITTSLTP